MAAAAVQNPPAQTDSKSAKKKKTKAERTESPAPTASPAPEKASSVSGQDGEESSNPYIRELQKNIRNVNKKIANASKTDSIVAQNKGKSLDELVAAKLLNADQKAQRLKKPQLESQLASLEEQLAQYKKIDEDYRVRGAADKAGIEKSLTEKLEKEKADAVAAVKTQAETDGQKLRINSLLVLSQFLRLAAARRTEEADPAADENMALEGVLLNVYSGDEKAVSTMVKLIDGVEEKTRSVNGDELQTTFAQVKSASVAHGAQFPAETSAEPTELPTETTPAVETDPTIAHAGLTEIDSAGSTAPLVNGHVEATSDSVAPANADTGDSAANAAAEAQWDNSNELSGSISQEWVDVKVPRDPAETETGVEATPAATANTQSWADDHPEPAAEVAAPVDPNGGFQEVQRNRPRQDRESGWRGRGRGGGYRGRGGFGGEGRGRGRGGPRGGGQRGGRRNEAS